MYIYFLIGLCVNRAILTHASPTVWLLAAAQYAPIL